MSQVNLCTNCHHNECNLKNKQETPKFTNLLCYATDGQPKLSMCHNKECMYKGSQDVNEQTQSLRNTPLHIAAKFGHLLVVRYLIEHGAVGNISNANGCSALDLAQESKEAKIYAM